MSGNDVLDPNAEIDLTQAGFQAERANFEIKSAEYKKTRAGTGDMLVVETQSVENLTGKDRPTSVILRFNVRNPNPKAVEIAQSDLKKLFNAVLGSPKGAPSALVGRVFSAEAFEAESGFIELRKYDAAA